MRTVFVFSTDIGMEFGTKKCGILNIKRRTVVRCEEIKLPNYEVMKEVDKKKDTHKKEYTWAQLNLIRSKRMK